MRIKEAKIKGGRRVGEKYWRYECRKARKEREFWKCWCAAYLFLLGMATMVIIYLMIYGRG